MNFIIPPNLDSISVPQSKIVIHSELSAEAAVRFLRANSLDSEDNHLPAEEQNVPVGTATVTVSGSAVVMISDDFDKLGYGWVVGVDGRFVKILSDSELNKKYKINII